MPLEPQGFASAHAELAAAVMSDIRPLAPMLATPLSGVFSETAAVEHSPPDKVIGWLPEPLIRPSANERDGYVPNVVYSCRSLVHGGQLVIPYGISNYATPFATLGLDQVLAAME